MASTEQLEKIKNSGIIASEKYAKDPSNKPAYTTRAWTGTFILPIIGTLIGLGVKSEGVESFERGKEAAKKQAEFQEASGLGIKGEELAKYGKEAKYAQVLDEKKQTKRTCFLGGCDWWSYSRRPFTFITYCSL